MRVPRDVLSVSLSPCVTRQTRGARGPAASTAIRSVVAIPARNEEAGIPDCLEALAAQVLPDGGAGFGVLLLLNNCVDRSLDAAKSFQSIFEDRLRIVTRTLAPERSHAGGARRLAMDLGANWLEDHGVGAKLLLTTDADSRVPPDWIAQNLASIAAGADAVAGDIRLDPEDDARLPEALRQRGALEGAYTSQLIEIAARLYPEPHNPWPHHATASGASLGLTLDAYRRIGGLPAVPLGEDRALVAALRAAGARIRFAPDINVITSGRLMGRAAGGAADTMRLRCEDPDAPCDESLAPLDVALRRMALRRAGIGFDVGESPRLAPSDLPEQIRLAALALNKLRARGGALGEVHAEAIEAFVADFLENALEAA